ncbi:hypothetical protein [Nocardia sp. CNY236]|uniref:hypothetical protein n=1 Tax=Nocardia sp. CNY236 TaxID=1169152 RepID=UPI0018CACDB3|nr:hypothetical protein [Nocardia sp. CNY236]
MSSVKHFSAMTTDLRHGSDRWLEVERVPHVNAGMPSTDTYVIVGVGLPDTFYLDANGNDQVWTNPRPSRYTPQMVDMGKPGQRVLRLGPPSSISGAQGPVAFAFAL